MRKSALVSSVAIGSAIAIAVTGLSFRRPSAGVTPRSSVTVASLVPEVHAAILTRDTKRTSPIEERVVEEAPMSLTASDGSGLVLAELVARAVVEGPLAFTEVHLAFDNAEDRVREGTFKIALPQTASLSRFAMKTGAGWQEGEVVAKDRARRVYEDYLHKKQDPALMEKGPGNEFSARVFPIPARGRKEIVVSYVEELADGAPYALPLRGMPAIGTLDVVVTEDGAPGGSLHRERFAPTADFVADDEGRASPSALRSGELVVARVRPVPEALPDPVKAAVVLVDTSASRALGLAGELRGVQSLMQRLAEREPSLHVSVAAFDQEVVPVAEGGADALDDAGVARLTARRALGASNLEEALAWARGESARIHATRVILVTDAVATAGEDDAQKLARAGAGLKEGGVERLDVVTVGGLRDDALAKTLATSGLARDGVVAAAGDGVSAIVRRLEEGTRSGIAVGVEGARWTYPTRLDGAQPGDEALVYAEVPAGTPVRVRVGDRVETVDAVPVEGPLLERAWARAKIASFEQEEREHGASAEVEKSIVDLSTREHVVSGYTSLLVLETDADYARFHIDRSKRDVLAVKDGQLLLAARGELPRSAAWMAPALAPRVATADKDAPPAEESAHESDRKALVDDAREAQSAERMGRGESLGALRGMSLTEPRSDHHASQAVAAAPATRAHGEEGSMGNPAAAPPPAGTREEALADHNSSSASGTTTEPPPPALRLARPAPRAPVAAAGGDARVARSAAAGYGAFGGNEDRGVDPYTGKLRQVKARLAARDGHGALDLASSWQASQPGDVLALVALGESSEAVGDSSTAARAYGSIIDLFASRADLRRFAGERLEHLESEAALDLAIDTFDKARRDRPDHPASHRLAAFARARKGDYAGAFDIGVAAIAQHYPEGRFRGVDRILREDLGLLAAAWIKREPERKSEILARLRAAGGTIEDGPSLRFVLNWETDSNDVDFHIEDSLGGHAYYASPDLASGGSLYADVTTGYGPECFTIRAPHGRRAGPYHLRAHYFSRGPMGYGMGKLEIIDHDGRGNLRFEERPFVVMTDQAFVDLGTVKN